MSRTRNRRFDSSESATVIAALRWYQENGNKVPSHIREIATDGGSFPALTSGEIDHLCEHIRDVVIPSRPVTEDLRKDLEDLRSRVGEIEDFLAVKQSSGRLDD